MFDGVQSLDVTGPAEVLAGASRLLRSGSFADLDAPTYAVHIASLSGGVIRTESAVALDSISFEALDHRLGREPDAPIDTLIIPGGFSVWRHAGDPDFMAALRNLVERSRRLVTVCSGAALGAACGALDGHRVATHWARAERIAGDHPDVTVDPEPIYIHSESNDRDVWSSAGITAGIDLTLALVENDHHTDLAQEIGCWLVMYLRRPGGQTQFATPTWIRLAPPGPVRAAQDLVVDDPGTDHSVRRIAARVGLSERHLVRRFSNEVGISPAQFVARVRVDAARHELERSDDTVVDIARRCGFGTAETFRRTMQRQLGVSPEAYRRRFGHRSTPTSSASPRLKRTTS